jgi:hypothetical protein
MARSRKNWWYGNGEIYSFFIFVDLYVAASNKKQLSSYKAVCKVPNLKQTWSLTDFHKLLQYKISLLFL